MKLSMSTHMQEKYKSMKRKVDDKWGRTLKYDHHFEWNVNLAVEQKVKAGDEKVGAEETRKAGISFGGKHGWETTTTREHLVSTEDSDTYTVKRVHKWTYSEDVKEPKSVLIQIKKITLIFEQLLNGKEELLATKRDTCTFMNQPSCITTPVATMKSIKRLLTSQRRRERDYHLTFKTAGFKKGCFCTAAAYTIIMYPCMQSKEQFVHLLTVTHVFYEF